MRYFARALVFGIALLGATASAQSADPRLGKLDAKTRLAVEAGTRQIGAWTGGAWLVDLTSHASGRGETLAA